MHGALLLLPYDWIDTSLALLLFPSLDTHPASLAAMSLLARYLRHAVVPRSESTVAGVDRHRSDDGMVEDGPAVGDEQCRPYRRWRGHAEGPPRWDRPGELELLGPVYMGEDVGLGRDCKGGWVEGGSALARHDGVAVLGD